jgi:hypothetical protein
MSYMFYNNLDREGPRGADVYILYKSRNVVFYDPKLVDEICAQCRFLQLNP